MPDGDAVRLVLSFWNLRQVLLKFSVERCLKRWVERRQDVMRGLVCRRGLRSLARDVRKADQVRAEGSIDVIDRVKDRSMQNREAASRVNGWRLSAGGSQDHQESSIPLDDWIDRWHGTYYKRSSRDLCLKTGAHESNNKDN